MKILIAFLMLCSMSVAYAREAKASKAEDVYSSACEILQNAMDAEKAKNAGNAIIAYRMADENFARVSWLDPDYRPQSVLDLRKSISTALLRLQPKSSPSPQKTKHSISSVVVSQTINLLIALLIVVVVTSYYREKRYPVHDKYHTFWPRFWTPIVDACVLWPVITLTLVMDTLTLPAIAIAAGLFVQRMTGWCYTIVMHARCGQTVGKMFCKVKVVDVKTEEAITVRQALLREGIPALLSLVFVGYQIYCLRAGRTSLDQTLLKNSSTAYFIAVRLPLTWFSMEVITMLMNEKRRALHDLIAGTVVLRTNIEPAASFQSQENEMTALPAADYNY